MTAGQRGFTLLELLLAVAISAVVAAAAIAALNAFTEADLAASRRLEETSGVNRTLQALRADVAGATVLRVAADRVLVTQRTGAAIAWVIAGGGTELHRLPAADDDAAAALADATSAAVTKPGSYTARGHLLDAEYQATAMLQGMAAVTFAAIAPLGTPLGVTVQVVGTTGRTTSAVALSLALAEAFTKSGAAAANAAVVSAPATRTGTAAPDGASPTK